MKTTERISITINTEILVEARNLGINLSKAATDGISAAILREHKIKELGL